MVATLCEDVGYRTEVEAPINPYQQGGSTGSKKQGADNMFDSLIQNVLIAFKVSILQS
mgnify:CR=1 FL=1